MARKEDILVEITVDESEAFNIVDRLQVNPRMNFVLADKGSIGGEVKTYLHDVAGKQIVIYYKAALLAINYK